MAVGKGVKARLRVWEVVRLYGSEADRGGSRGGWRWGREWRRGAGCGRLCDGSEVLRVGGGGAGCGYPPPPSRYPPSHLLFPQVFFLDFLQKSKCDKINKDGISRSFCQWLDAKRSGTKQAKNE